MGKSTVQVVKPSATNKLPGKTWVAVLVLSASLFAAYANTFHVPFLLDDISSIHENETIRSLSTSLLPGGNSGNTVSGRPLLNLTLAINYAIGGESLPGYHLGNLLIHTLAAATLFGLIRQCLHLPLLRDRFEHGSWWSALSISAIWSLHPLQTESVTYIIQRAEALVSLFYLLSLYCFVRAAGLTEESANRRAYHRWLTCSVIACLLGMGSKEVMASAPLIVLLMDRTFVSGSFRKAWNTRKEFYIALAGTWLFLLAAIIWTRGRGGTVSIGGVIPVWHYALTQCHAIWLYLRLAAWPHPLTFDYGLYSIHQLTDVWLQAFGIILLLIITGWSLWKKPAIGFLGTFFFLILAPSSSIIPVITQTMAEHRMYLALAPVVIFSVLGIQRYWPKPAIIGSLLVAAGFAFITSHRNADYQSVISLWTDTVKKQPANFRAWCGLGGGQITEELFAGAKFSFENALVLNPGEPEIMLGYANALFKNGEIEKSLQFYQKTLSHEPSVHSIAYSCYHNYGVALAAAGRLQEAVENIRKAIDMRPKIADAYYSLGNALVAAQQPADAALEFEKALARDDSLITARANLGNALISIGRFQEAIDVMTKNSSSALKSAELCYNLGLAQMNLGKTPEAIESFGNALRIKPRFTQAHINLGILFATHGDATKACEQYQAAIDSGEKNPVLYASLGRMLQKLQRNAEAIDQFKQAVTLAPDDWQLRYFLASALAEAGQLEDATRQYTRILQLAPDIPEIHNALGSVYQKLSRTQEARTQFEAALRLRPDYPEAKENLSAVR